MEDEDDEDEEANLKSQFFIYERQKPNVSTREKTALRTVKPQNH